MSPCSRHKARFITQDGVYEWKSAIRFDELTYFLSNTHVWCISKNEFQILDVGLTQLVSTYQITSGFVLAPFLPIFL